MTIPARFSCLLAPLSVLLALSGCAAPKFLRYSAGTGLEQPMPARVALSPLQRVGDSGHHPVGNLLHKGGMVRQAPPDGFVRSKEISVQQADRYSARAADWVRRTLAQVVRDQGTRLVPWTAVDSVLQTGDESPLQWPDMQQPKRGRGGDDSGQDNVHLPYTQLTPNTHWPAVAAAAQGLQPVADAVLVPTLVYYYTHNNGWFTGQQWGAPVGARFRLVWAMYSTTNGELLGWQDIDVRETKPGVFHTDRLAYEELLTLIEDNMAQVLTLTAR